MLFKELPVSYRKMVSFPWTVVMATEVIIVSVYSLFCCILGMAAEPVVPALIVFGDSTADVGTNAFINTLVKANFAPYGENFVGGRPTGRFTNGYMIGDFIALKLGLPLNLPYLDPEATGERILKGVNFASAGSGYIETTSMVMNVVDATMQLEMFNQYQMKLVNLVGHERTSFILSEAIFAVSAGSNDFIVNYLFNPLLQMEYTIDEWDGFILSNQTQFIKQLYKAGARKVVVFGFLPLGCLPGEITVYGNVGPSGRRCLEDKNKIAIEHNIRLQEAIFQWQADLPGIRILYGDVYTFVYEASNNPSKYGYTETRKGCCGEGLLATAIFCNANSLGTCSDPSTYMFFDSMHPTEKLYKDITERSLWPNMVKIFGLKI